MSCFAIGIYYFKIALYCSTGRLFLYGEHNKKCENYYHSYVFHANTPFHKGVETAATVSLQSDYIKYIVYVQVLIVYYIASVNLQYYSNKGNPTLP